MIKDGDGMSLTVYFDKELYDNVKQESQVNGRSFTKQVTYLVNLGMILEENPEIKKQLILKKQLQK